ncbi:DUF3040 domain-containing protein [Rhodococcoides corynebacterioides]|uniref:DUF3040 domain-containing protein n=1 Tax=Rhodococcoides corynebacterioides TaxID=53972 RepID=UPI000830F9B3|nr:DUF3040 domain-containing protein [Rhodococcus corynebacterioides]
MPLSEHEQRMLDQIESALYAEDPKFASTVRGGRIRAASTRRRFQAIALFVVGLVLLIAGVALPVKPGGFPIISLVGFAVMFGAGVLLLVRKPGAPTAETESEGGAEPSGPPSSSRRPGPTARGTSGQRGAKRPGFSARMEERFRRRFDQG